MNLDLTGVSQLLFDLLGDVAGQQNHLILADLLGLDHHADLAAGLDRIRACDAWEALGDLLQLFQTLDVVFDVLTARAGACGGDGVGRLNQAGFDGMGLR